MVKSLIVIIIAATFLSGCGLVFQGTRQTIRLATEPEGAAIKFAGKTAVSPATITLSRRVRGPELFGAQKEGYFPACSVNDCGTPRWIKVLDSIPAALPLLVDLAAGTLGNCDDATLFLEPIRPGFVSFELPSNSEILDSEGDAVCAFPYLYDTAFAAAAEHIIVSSGSLQQPYELLGNVDFGKLGFDRTDASAIALRGLVLGWARRTFSKATPAEVNSLLRKRALYMYGERVDALINVNYQSDPANSVFATAVAVHFTGSEQPRWAAPSARLEELEKLRRGGLIDQREYDQKRAEILRGL